MSWCRGCPSPHDQGKWQGWLRHSGLCKLDLTQWHLKKFTPTLRHASTRRMLLTRLASFGRVSIYLLLRSCSKNETKYGHTGLHTVQEERLRSRKCYLAKTNYCLAKITGEHCISHNLLNKIERQNKTIDVVGLSWLPKEQLTSIGKKNLVANVLCEQHNSMLSPLDAAVGQLIEAIGSIDMDLLSNAPNGFVSGKWGGCRAVGIKDAHRPRPFRPDQNKNRRSVRTKTQMHGAALQPCRPLAPWMGALRGDTRNKDFSLFKF